MRITEDIYEYHAYTKATEGLKTRMHVNFYKSQRNQVLLNHMHVQKISITTSRLPLLDKNF